MLPSASLETWPEMKMKSPARTAGWNGRLGFFLPITEMPGLPDAVLSLMRLLASTTRWFR